MIQPKEKHVWKYYKRGEKYHCEIWVCQNCGITALKNPFEFPGYIYELEETRKKLLAERSARQLKRRERQQTDRDNFNKRKNR